MPDGGGDGERLTCRRDIVRPDDGGAVIDGNEMRGERSAEPLHRLGRGDRMNEALARGADQKRQIKAAPGIEMGDTGKALLRGLAKANAGIEHDTVARNTGFPGDFER